MNNCILWPSALAHGYPMQGGHLVRRTIYSQYHTLPEASAVFTVCGAKDCINDEHLTLQRPGPSMPSNRKLESEDIQSLRVSYATYPHPTYSALASAFGVSMATIQAAIIGLTYRS